MILRARRSRLVSLSLFQTVPYLLFGRVNDYYLSVERNYYPWQQINYCHHPLCSLRKLLCSRIYIRLFFSSHPYVFVFFIKSVHFTISIGKYLAAALKHLLTYRAPLYAFLKRTDLIARSSMNIFCIYTFRSHCIPRSACVTVSAAEFCCFLDYDVSNRVLCCLSICNLTAALMRA